VTVSCPLVVVLLAALSYAADTPYAAVSREKLLAAMQSTRGYDPTATTNAGRFSVEVLLALAASAEKDKTGVPLFIGHEEWFQAFVELRGLTPETAPLYARLARQYKQDMLVEHRTDRVIERVVTGPSPQRALVVVSAWPETRNGPTQYSFQDLLARPTLQVTNHRRIRYRVLAYDDRIVVDEVDGLSGRPSSGALGLLFKVIGEGRVVEYRMTIAPDGTTVSRGRAKKGFFGVSSTLTVQPDGKAEKDVPEGRADLRALAKRLEEPIDVRTRPLPLSLYGAGGT
jgi:hypothetical protein